MATSYKKWDETYSLRIFIVRFKFIVFYILLFSLGGCVRKISSNQPHVVTKDDYNELESALKENGEVFLSNRIYSLGGKKLIVNGRLIFSEGTKVINGTLEGNEGEIIAPLSTIFKDIEILGNWINSSMPLIWFTIGNDPRENYAIFYRIFSLGKRIILDKMYNVLPLRNVQLPSINLISFQGVGKEECGLVLEKYDHAFFQCRSLLEVFLDNITLVTQDYREDNINVGSQLFINYERSFGSSVRFNRIEITDCQIQGNVRMAFKGLPSDSEDLEFHREKIGHIIVSGSQFINVENVLSVSNLTYDTMLIKENQFFDIYGPVISAGVFGLPESYPHDRIINERIYTGVLNNTVHNSKAVQSINKEYLSLIVAKGRTFEIIDNRIDNLLNLSSVETYPFYCSASNYLLIENNKIRNCGALSSFIKIRSSLCKLKGSVQTLIKNNDFAFDRNGLLQLGLINVSDQPLYEMDSSSFQFCLLDAWNLNLDSTSKLVILNNNFYLSVLTDVTHVFNNTFVLRGNNIFIDHIRTTDLNNYGSDGVRFDHTLFNFRNSVSEGILEVIDNYITVNSMDNNVFHFTYNIIDNKQYDYVLYEDNVFDCEGTVSIDYPKARKLTTSNRKLGQGTIGFSKAQSIRKDKSVRNFSQNLYVDDYTDFSSGLMGLRDFGVSRLEVGKTLSDKLTVLNIKFNDLYFFRSDDGLPLLLTVHIKELGGSSESILYKLVFKDYRSVYFLHGENDELMRHIPYWKKDAKDFNFVIKPSNSDQSNLELSLESKWNGRSIDGEGYLIFEHLDLFSSYEINVTIENYIYSSGTPENESIFRTIKNVD